ncbi:thiamine ABC transporter substrate-binding protein [Schaalia suimastitidis]|uniref:thiamine ABC transporter substrate-binding protein n=1 Tax=Schaalia suimastitidis TaxID=121163 RepID=UPI000418BDB4|nr:thiamine ABC transporter substrate-binding protein [Schaalia suimastitidis]
MAHTRPLTRLFGTVLTVASIVALAACTTQSTSDTTDTSQAASETSRSIVVLSHDSFDFPQELLDTFTANTGIEVTIQAIGDGGTLANQLVLTKDAPLGDAVYGLDNTVSYRIAGQGVIAETTVTSPNENLNFAGEAGLIPIDQGDVCVNFDKTWFADKGMVAPQTFEDLSRAEYKDLLVAMNPATSTPGMAFMLATIAHFGQDGWVEYWQTLKDNGVKVTQGWSEAFAVDYSAGEGSGPYPMMVSYGSSPAYSVNDEGTDTSTASMSQTCYRQVEYAGVLAGAKDANGAAQFIEYMLTPEVQAAISEVTYMFPTVEGAQAPENLVTFGPLSPTPVMIPADDVAANAEVWLRTWQSTVIG